MPFHLRKRPRPNPPRTMFRETRSSKVHGDCDAGHESVQTDTAIVRDASRLLNILTALCRSLLAANGTATAVCPGRIPGPVVKKRHTIRCSRIFSLSNNNTIAGACRDLNAKPRSPSTLVVRSRIGLALLCSTYTSLALLCFAATCRTSNDDVRAPRRAIENDRCFS